jgi:protein-tyrosine phosphatase
MIFYGFMSSNTAERKSCLSFSEIFSICVMHHPLTKVLFVCMGNICRSPAAEIIFHQQVKQAGLGSSFLIDSAGTTGYHEGNPPDRRMIRTLEKRGYSIFGCSRPVVDDDFSIFDHILIMDQDNERELLKRPACAPFRHKIRFLTNFATRHKDTYVPDPYYGGDQGFEHVADLIEDACAGLLEKLKSGADL